MASDVNELTAELEKAVAEDTATEESSTEESGEEAKTPEGEKKSRGAQARIRELVEKSKTLEEELTQYKSQVGEKDKELGKLVDLLQARENDAKVVKKIQELYASDEKWKDTIEKLDKVIRGEEVEEAEEKTKDPSFTKTKDLLSATRKELDEALAEQKADLLLHKSELMIDRYMGELPEQYGPEDKRRIQSVLKDHIDWDAIEANPNKLGELVHKGVQNAVTWYGTPQGVNAKVDKETTETKVTPESPKERLDKIMSMDVGKLRTVKTDKGEVKVPELSDDDFVKLLGESLRLKNRGL